MTQFSAWPLGGGVWVGPVRKPRNSAANQKGSIHDDAIAQKLGFRGGTVAASLHMEQFPPLLMHMFGPRWWQSGGLSLYFRYATTDLEAAQCHAVAPMRSADRRRPHRSVDGTSETGRRVRNASPTAPRRSAVPICGSALRQRIQLMSGAGRTADSCAASRRTRVATACRRASRRARSTNVSRSSPNRSTSTRAASPWGRPALPPSLMVRAMRAVEPELLARTGPVVGLFGAIEVQHLNGPLFVETDYLARGRVLAISDTPKTEFFWYEIDADRPR